MEHNNKPEGRSNSNKRPDYIIEGDWNKQSGVLKEQYPTLTNEDVKFESGREIDLFERIESRLEKNRNEVIGILKTNQKKV